MVKNPVLFETFARVETARKVWENIKKAKPSKLYFYSNKAREGKTEEIKRNTEIRSWIKEVDWDCSLHVFFREYYVDIYESVYSSKKWLFENEETGIILEDDCVPSVAFFEFCDHFLDEYKDNTSINFITGNNYVNNYDVRGCDHIISKSVYHYGWATWKDRWESIDFNIDAWQIIKKGYFFKYFREDLVLCLYNILLYSYLRNFIKDTKCWDYIKVLHQIKTNSYAVSPIYNLIHNIGMDGTHNHDSAGVYFNEIVGGEDSKYKFTYNVPKIIPDNYFDKLQTAALGERSIRVMAQLLKGLISQYVFTKK